MSMNTSYATNISTPTTTAASTPNHTLFPAQQKDTSTKSSPVPPTPPLPSPSNPQRPQPIVQKAPTDSILSKRLPEEELQHREVKKRFIESLLEDHKLVTQPDYHTPFTSLKDAMDRLMPYHIYQYPKHDLDANKIPLERQDHTMIEIFKCQTDLFVKFSVIAKKMHQQQDMTLKIIAQREVVAAQRQKLTDEQSRVAAEQAVQQQEMLRLQAEKARLATEQPPSDPFQAVNYANGLAQASALLQNPQFLNHYNQLSPELQQRLLRNREQLVALIEKQQYNNNISHNK
ncbi:uncharacterized protein B0P05DRAFT_641392 [Gilbertella persicaria]|nr:uncharacterized protein B0P05DRAFT_641392 [Gilbertella persicaria]KAI8053671.1 hypothetical protein B0P05DRAFT_641392 [Gilbertella persicaria]